MLTSRNADATVVASPASWIEGEAIAQLEATAALPGIVRAVGLPDLHPGRGTPIGAAFFARDVVYPHLVGSDIGCGMSLVQTDVRADAAKRDRWAKRLRGLERPWEGDAAAYLAARAVPSAGFETSLGTIGGGNHFAEIVRVEQELEPGALRALDVDPSRLLLLVHSGSRGLGDAVLRAHTATRGAGPLDAASDEGRRYLDAHDRAARWAVANRELIAERLLEQLGAAGERRIDVCHNAVRHERDLWVHRKGAAPHGDGPVVIPGSRGSLSYIVIPTGDGASGGYSLAHGAGRKWKRRDARARVRAIANVSELERTKLGSRVICEDKDLLYEEAPFAYKEITRVIADLVEHGLARPVATLRPVLTYKVRSGAGER